MTHKFIVNTESINSYGYRVLTEGIDIEQYMKNPVVLFMHERYDNDKRGSEVIGRTVNLTKENGQLIAEIEFDAQDEFSQKIAKKVEGGFLRMASIYAENIESSTAPEDLMPGQTYATVKKCKLIEISIVDIGGNDDALKLSKVKNGEIILEKIIQTENNMSQLKTIALALGKEADAPEADLLSTINELKLAKETAEANENEWKGKFIALQKSEAEALVNKAVQLGLLNEAFVEAQVNDLLSNFEEKKVVLSKLITDKEEELAKEGNSHAVATVVELANRSANETNGEEKETFDYLQKKDPVKLAKIKADEPEKYTQLAKDYMAGVRFNG